MSAVTDRLEEIFSHVINDDDDNDDRERDTMLRRIRRKEKRKGRGSVGQHVCRQGYYLTLQQLCRVEEA